MDDLQMLFQVYPLQYLSIRMDLHEVYEVQEHSAVLAQAPKLLKEVVVENLSYWTHEEEHGFLEVLLQLNLECLSMLLRDLDECNIQRFVDQCLRSQNKHHVISPDFIVEGNLPHVNSQFARLAREDKGLLSLHVDPRLIDLKNSGLLCDRNGASRSSLQHLKVRYPPLRHNQISVLGRALAGNCKLVSLSVMVELLNKDDLVRLGEAIACSTALLAFHGDFRDCSEVGLNFFVEELARSRTLETLTLMDVCRHTRKEEATTSIATLLKVSSSLRFLDLDRYNLGAGSAARRILDATESSTSLEVLSMRWCRLSQDKESSVASYASKKELEIHFSNWRTPCTALLPRRLIWRPMRRDEAIHYQAHEWRRRGAKINPTIYSDRNRRFG